MASSAWSSAQGGQGSGEFCPLLQGVAPADPHDSVEGFERLLLELSDALAGNAVDLPNLFQGQALPVDEPEPETQDLSLPLRPRQVRALPQADGSQA